MKKRLVTILLLFFIGFFYSFAQDNKRTNIWYFGYGAGLDFNFSPPQPLSDGQIQTREGCATRGNLVFLQQNLPIQSDSGWWDGRYQGELMPRGVYTFLLELEGEFSGGNLRSGDVLLIR